MALLPDRRLENDWYDGRVPENVEIGPQCYLESAFSFTPYRAEGPCGLSLGRGSHIYSSTLFDVGKHGSVAIGEGSMLNGARLICEQRIEIGAYATISWNVIFMDCYRLPSDPDERRGLIERAARAGGWSLAELTDLAAVPSSAIILHDNVWIGFDTCILPGVTIGEGSVVGARSLVVSDVPAYTVVAGNPARPIRDLPRMAAGPDPKLTQS
jgi:acetyltransferase-like isoleucine patch superfamily enzyme